MVKAQGLLCPQLSEAGGVAGGGWRVSFPRPRESRCPAWELAWLWLVNQGKAAPSLPALRMGGGCSCLLGVHVSLSPRCTHRLAWGTEETLDPDRS